jgi:glycine/D-amino acid oxidase-like deaminating enzyme
VTALDRRAGSWCLRTEGGASVTADTGVLTTNALIGNLVPLVQRSLIPVRSYQVATQPLGAEVQARILPHRQPLADLRNHTFALRWSADNRLVTGGGAVINDPTAGSRMARFFLRRLRDLVPGLPELEPAYAWNGVVAATGDFLPRLWSLGPGLIAPIGCNGRGVALTTALGQALAGFIASGDADMVPLPVTEPQPWRWHGLARFGPSAWLARARWRDALAARAG